MWLPPGLVSGRIAQRVERVVRYRERSRGIRPVSVCLGKSAGFGGSAFHRAQSPGSIFVPVPVASGSGRVRLGCLPRTNAQIAGEGWAREQWVS